ncbi:MAG: site-specific DNA-methyltransferase [Anaerolineae bacterium]|nr:site-specific DNA-methyltransferase [Anaerolineae bacterium]
MALPLDTILNGDCVEVLKALPEKSVDLIFADPPYNLQLQNELIRPNQTLVNAVNDEWDKFADFASYDEFTEQWLSACRRVLTDEGSIWVIGSYHNIFRVGRIMMDLGFWVLNDVIWHKTNPMPNFRGTRFTNATETMIWAKKAQEQKRYTFNYHAMKNLNDEKQMPNVWQIPLCTGAERVKVNGKKAHSTQKPEALLYRVLLASSNAGDVVLDPFFGSGTTGAVAKKLKRHYIGIEREPAYVDIARQRIAAIPAPEFPVELAETESKRDAPRISFATLVEAGTISIGTRLFDESGKCTAAVCADGRLDLDGFRGSIHRTAAHLLGEAGANGWDFWHFRDDHGELHPLDDLRQQYRQACAETPTAT